MDAAGALQAREEFRAPQAVQPQVALQRTVQSGRHRALILRMQLAHDLLDRVEHHGDRIGMHRLWLR
jgi:hypothetical protein